MQGRRKGFILVQVLVLLFILTAMTMATFSNIEWLVRANQNHWARQRRQVLAQSLALSLAAGIKQKQHFSCVVSDSALYDFNLSSYCRKQLNGFTLYYRLSLEKNEHQQLYYHFLIAMDKNFSMKVLIDKKGIYKE